MTSSYMISPGTTNEDLAIKRRLALALMQQGSDTSPVQHWTQGAARMLQGGLGGYEMYRAKEEDREETAKGNALLAAFLGGGQGATPVVPSAAPSPASVSMAPTSGKVYENNEPSPLDPPSGTDRDLLIRTVLAEAGNQGPVGMQAVANVARNRAVAGNFGGDTIPGVIQKPYQFEPHNTEAGRAKMAAIDPASPQYAAADAAVSRAYAGDDPTRGATHFYAPKTQAALGRSAPSWDNGTGVDIKDHRFFGGAGTPPVTAGASPTEVSAQSVRPQPAAPGVPNREALIQMLGNRKTAPIAQQIISQQIQQQFNPSYDFQVAGENLYRIDKRKGTAEPVAGATKPTYGVIGKDQFGNEQYGWIDPAKRTTTPAAGGASPSATATPPTVTGPDGKLIPIPPGVDPKKFRADVTGAVADAATGKKTEVQANSEQFANRMEQAEAAVAGLESEGTSLAGKALSEAPYGISTVGNYCKGANRQKFEQARSQFITGLLRRESGAAIAKEEFARYDKEFFPQPGDGPEVIRQKAEARRVAIDAMKKSAGPGYKSPAVAEQKPQSVERKSISGKNYIKQNGQWFEE